MPRTWFVVGVLAVAACGGGSSAPQDAPRDTQAIDAVVNPPTDAMADAMADARPDASGVCNPLTQSGCSPGDKCTWIVDALMPQYAGHIGCAPSGTAAVGNTCSYGPPGATGYDDCAKGLVCSAYHSATPGVCKAICDQQGGAPACSSDRVCVAYAGLFATGATTPAAAGVCDPACHPLDDNDFDGAGALTKTGSACGSGEGCYGYPSFGTPPVTAFSCTTDINAGVAQPTGLRHRVTAPGPTLHVNSCNQGYLPILRESSTVSTAVCIAMCKPKNCYAGNCGANDSDRLGQAPHRCSNVDAVGTFDTSLGGEHCRYLWYFERDSGGTYLPSPWSDSVGICFDHSKYLYDSNNDGVADAPFPPCALLAAGNGTGSNPADPLTYFGAADLGCVDSATAGIPLTAKSARRRADELRLPFRVTPAP